VHLGRERHVGQRCIALQLPQDGPVGAVDAGWLGNGILCTNFCCAHGFFYKISIARQTILPAIDLIFMEFSQPC
jgi:hypothetical protein